MTILSIYHAYLLLQYLLWNFTGAKLEVNISHRCRQDILTTPNLAHQDLFKSAQNEVLQLMKTVCRLLGLILQFMEYFRSLPVSKEWFFLLLLL